MIVVRNIFQIKAGMMKQAVALIREGPPMTQREVVRTRALTDLVSDFYTLVLEMECETLGDFEKAMQTSFASAEWQAWYQRLTPLVQSGRRELMSVVT